MLWYNIYMNNEPEQLSATDYARLYSAKYCPWRLDLEPGEHEFTPATDLLNQQRVREENPSLFDPEITGRK